MFGVVMGKLPAMVKGYITSIWYPVKSEKEEEGEDTNKEEETGGGGDTTEEGSTNVPKDETGDQVGG